MDFVENSLLKKGPLPECPLFGSSTITIVSRVSTHERLNITRNFGLHGCLPGTKMPYICIEAATVAL